MASCGKSSLCGFSVFYCTHTNRSRVPCCSEIDGLARHASPVFLDSDYSPAALAVRWQGYFAGPSGFPNGK
jgi:hypothetical protein